MSERDAVGAFVPGVDVRIEGAEGGPLTGLTFAAKDLFDVAGHTTSGGSPDWLTSHRTAATLGRPNTRQCSHT